MVSIVIPVYNVVQYLDVCLSSVFAQTYTHFECILVDDGSMDGSGGLCDEWARKDARIRVFHQKNKGVSAARNKGIMESVGDYVTFIDSDDWVEPTYLENLLSALEKSHADVSVCGLVQDFCDGRSVPYMPTASETISLVPQAVEKFVELNRKFLLYGPVVKLYRLDIIRHNLIIFPLDSSYGEDLIFNYQYLEHVRTITTIATVGYHYRIIGQGTLSSSPRIDQFGTDYRQWQLLKAFYVKKNMWTEPAKRMLYERLWGIVYDGIFSTQTANRDILSIPEIDELKNYKEVYECAGWIKWCILHRLHFMFHRRP